MMPIQCASCKNYIDDMRCEAYQVSIPYVILTGEHDHAEPYEGDNGIQFEPIDE